MNHGITIGVVKKQITQVQEANSNELKYIANLTQTLTGNPVATVLRNDFGLNIEWKRESANKFSGNISDYKFSLNRTTLQINKPTPETKIFRNNTSQILIECLDGKLKETTVEISVIELNGLFSMEFNQIFN